MRRIVVPLIGLAVSLVGCASGNRGAADPPGDGQAAAYRDGVSADAAYPVGIDDDRGSTDVAGAVAAVLMAPVTLVGDMISLPISAMKSVEGDTAGRDARMTLDKSSADNRRVGVMKLVDYGFARRPPYTTHYEQMAQADADPTVRAAAIRACNRARDRKATRVFIAALSDKSDLVKLEAAKGLANLPDPDAAGPLLKLATDPDADRDVRIAATDALKYYRTLPVGRSLCTLLADHDFSIAWQARRSLVYLTHRNFAYDESAWLGYLAGPEKPMG